ncbi:MAG: amidohydrolase [Candidatus Eisenbacteria bacterium]|nr:amidohydrolase [Candidatus Eisenbacteria bacterium]
MKLDDTAVGDGPPSIVFVNGVVVTMERDARLAGPGSTGAQTGAPRQGDAGTRAHEHGTAPAPATVPEHGNAEARTRGPDTTGAQAFWVKDGKFVCVGTNDEVTAAAPKGTPVADLGGATVLPGLTDCHLHLLDYARGRSQLDFSAVTTSRELTELVAEKVRTAQPGEWILGQGWNDALWKDRKAPHRDLLDSVSPQNPVFLSRVDVHTVLVNSLALKTAGVTRDTPDPAGGRVEKEPGTGEPTGVLVDDARALVQGLVPQPTRQSDGRALQAAITDLTSRGLTAAHDAMATLELLSLLRETDAAGRLALRTSLMLAFDEFERLEALSADARADALRPGRVTVRTVKLFADGALGSRGALLFEPYSDAPDTRGVEKLTAEELLEMVKRILRAGLQPAVHAIGDLANSRLLDAYERCAADSEFRSAFSKLRPRLEHAQLLRRGDVARCGRLGIIVSVQPPQLMSDMSWTEERVGPERARTAFLFGSLARAGATLVSGSDLPVESCDPFRGIYAAVTRRNLRGEPPGGWLPEERLSRGAALRSYTLDAAYSSFEENTHGSIAAGKSADFVVIDRDVLTVPEDDIHKTRVLATFAQGRRTA